MKKIYTGILLTCLWVQRKTTARVGSPWWYWSARIGSWAATKAGAYDELL